MGWKYVWSQSSLRHTGNWAWRWTVLSLPPVGEMHSNVAMYWNCSYFAIYFILQGLDGPYPRANIVIRSEKFTSVINRMESKKVRNENVPFDTFFVYIFDFNYFDLNINICAMKRESVNCSLPSGVVWSTSVWFYELCLNKIERYMLLCYQRQMTVTIWKLTHQILPTTISPPSTTGTHHNM